MKTPTMKYMLRGARLAGVPTTLLCTKALKKWKQLSYLGLKIKTQI